MRFTYQIVGMHCSSCIEKIQSSLSTQFKITSITLEPPILEIESETQPLLNDLNTRLALLGNYRLQLITYDDKEQEIIKLGEKNQQQGFKAYYPIFLIASYIIGVAFVNNAHWQSMNWHGWMSQFMAGFFLVFSAFKFLDLKGFAKGYATYDLLARRWNVYGFIYPFLELGLGILYLKEWMPVTTQCLTVLIMGFSSLGVINSLLKKQTIICACLGTILKVPLSSITLFEDLIMVGLAILSLITNG